MEGARRHDPGGACLRCARGRALRVSLAREEPGLAGKTSAHTDTYHGHFGELVVDQQVVEVMEFDTTNPDMQGWMTPTVELSDEPGGVTWLVALHEGLPPGVVPEDNEAGQAGGAGRGRLSGRVRRAAAYAGMRVKQALRCSISSVWRLASSRS